ncbi:MAG: hypothetical protein JNK73_14760 [Bacteroidia bacterium]|nr:hypothetical protein [Bacteroidia bacterium]
MKRGIQLLLTAVLFGLFSCAPSRFVKPLEKNQKAISFSFGGPGIMYSGAPIPIPFSTLAYAQGINSSITAFGALHFTSSLFGNLQADLGASCQLFELESGLGMSAAPALQLAYSVGTAKTLRAWPSGDINVYYHLFKKPSYLYGGLNAWFEFSKYKAHNELQTRHVIPNLQLGYVFVKPKWQHQFEFKFIGMGIPNTPGVVDYVGLNGKGSIGFYYNLIRTF